MTSLPSFLKGSGCIYIYIYLIFIVVSELERLGLFDIYLASNASSHHPGSLQESCLWCRFFHHPLPQWSVVLIWSPRYFSLSLSVCLSFCLYVSVSVCLCLSFSHYRSLPVDLREFKLTTISEHGQLGDGSEGKYFVTASRLSFNWVANPTPITRYLGKVGTVPFLLNIVFV